jgi:hypothetical protein
MGRAGAASDEMRVSNIHLSRNFKAELLRSRRLRTWFCVFSLISLRDNGSIEDGALRGLQQSYDLNWRCSLA